MSDIPQKLKFDTITKPLFEYCFGTSDDRVWEKFGTLDVTFYESEENNSEIMMKIDWIRDRTFIYSQIFDLVFENFVFLANKLGFWKIKPMVMDIIEHYDKYYNVTKLPFLSDDFRNDKEIVMAAVENGSELTYASERLRNDFEIVKKAVQTNGYILSYASQELRNNKEIVMTAIKQNGAALEYASSELRNDKEIAMIAVEAYKFISSELQNDRDVVMKALSKYNMHTKHFLKFSDIFQNDREFLLEVSKVNGFAAMNYGSNNFRNDRQIVMQSVQQDPLTLEFASNELKRDKEIVKLAVTQNGSTLRYASSECKDDEDIVGLALKSETDAIYYISNRLRGNAEFIRNAVGKRGFKKLPNKFKDREIILESLKMNVDNFTQISTELKNNRGFILQSLSVNGLLLSYLKDEFKQDREICFTAVSQNGNALQNCSKYFNEDAELVLKAAETYNYVYFYSHVSDKLRNDREFNLEVVKRSGRLLFEIINRKLRLDRELQMAAVETSPELVFKSEFNYKLHVEDRVLAIKAVKRDGLVLQYMCSKHRNDREIVSFAVQQNKKALEFASEQLRNDEKILALCVN